ncbi:hypothetical protein [Pandoraea sputorum]|uniref:hypothetical protein n=1 Tax=Pandoraea sputorum TaxID=93222 RepID=UPI001240F6FB|nr:hypothetical protein [Pandoraea sputorum]
MNSRQRDFFLIGLSVYGGWCLAALLPWKVVAGQTTKDWVDVLAALGAVGAVIATIAVYVFQQQSKISDERASGALAFLRSRSNLNKALALAAAIESQCRNAIKIAQTDYLAILPIPERLLSKCKEASSIVSSGDLEQLIRLGGKPVHRFAQAVELLRSIESELELLLDGRSFGALNEDQRHQFLRKWEAWAGKSRAMMLAAIDEFAEIASPSVAG